jgi:hypothetical protein
MNDFIYFEDSWNDPIVKRKENSTNNDEAPANEHSINHENLT